MADQQRDWTPSWAILELMGHRRLGGMVSEATIAGSAMLRIDVPGPDGATMATQFYGGGSVYCLTPTTEAMARAVARTAQPEPVARWELPQLPQSTEGDRSGDEDNGAPDLGEEF